MSCNNGRNGSCVQWSDPYRWKSLVLHPGMMHTLISFLGCIGTLMKASGVDLLLTAAFGGVAGIITGKALTNALRGYRLISTVLLQDFFHSGAKTLQELNEYLEAVIEHPVSPARLLDMEEDHQEEHPDGEVGDGTVLNICATVDKL